MPESRPTSIWITELLFGVTAVFLGIGILASSLACFSPGLNQCWIFRSPGSFVSMFLGVLFLIFLVRGLHQRVSICRWLAVGFLSFIALSALFQGHYVTHILKVFQGIPLPSPPHECWIPEEGNLQEWCGYNNYGEFTLQLINDVIKPLIVGLLISKLVKSKAVQQYFNTSKVSQ